MGLLQDYMNSPAYGLGYPYVAPDGTVYQFNNTPGQGQDGAGTYAVPTEMYTYNQGQTGIGQPFQATNLATGKQDTRAFQDDSPISDFLIPLTAVMGGLAMGGGFGAGAGAAGPGEAGWGMDLGMGAGAGGGAAGPGMAGWGMDLGGAGGAFGPGEAGWGMDLGGLGESLGLSQADMTSLMSSSGMDQAAIDQMFRSGGAGMGGSASGLGGLASKLFGGGGGGLMQLLGGALGLNAGKKGQDLVNDLIKRSDPFADYRKGYADKLAGMFADPAGTVTQVPGFAAGQEAITRSMAAGGYLGSGNMMAEMQKYGGDQWMKQAQFLSQLAGSQFAPGNNAVGLANIAGQSNATTNNSWANILKGIGGLAPTIMNSFGGGGDGFGSFGSGADYANGMVF